MYQILFKANGQSSPRFVCDVCGKVIDDLSLGNTTFTRPENDEPGLTDVTEHLHKECESARPRHDRAPNWHPLDVDVIYLLVSYGFLTADGKPTPAMRKAVEQAKRLSEF